jgi:hypothetical protein
MWVLIDRLGLVLFDATIATAFLLSLTSLAILVCRQPARRLFIARVALWSSLLIFPLVGFAPLPRVDLVRLLMRSRLIQGVLGDGSVHATRIRGRGAISDLQSPLAGVGSLRIARTGDWLVRGLALLDLAAIATGFAWLVLGIWGVHWLVRQSHEPDAETQALFQQLRLGGSRSLAKTALRIAPRLHRPAVVGLFHPTILLPASFNAGLSDRDQVRLSLLHEMAHIEQRDHWLGALANFAQTAWFLLPHMWWLRAQIRIEQEYLADRFAASRFGSSSGYAASLLLLAAQRAEPRPMVRPSAVISDRQSKSKANPRSPLFLRLLMLLHCPHRIEGRAPRLWSWTLQVAALGLTLVAASVCIRWPESGATELPASARVAAKHHPLHIADFVATPSEPAAADRASEYVLPVILPDRFDLKVQVLATRADLARARMAGYRLGLPRWAAPPTSASPPQPEWLERERWHQVHFMRQGADVRLWLDDFMLPVRIKPGPALESLTIEPSPQHSLRFRNFVMDW